MIENNDDNQDYVEISENITINKVFSNKDNSLISIVQNDKVNFFDTSEYKEFADRLGDSFANVSICLPLYRSHIVLIVGEKSNEEYPYNHICLYDLSMKQTIGKIELNLKENDNNDKIYNLYVNCKSLYVVLHHKILLFNIITLQYITTFYDVLGKTGLVSLNSIREENLTPYTTLAYVSRLNPQIIKIYKIKFTEGDLIYYSQHFLTTDFEKVQFISVSSKNKFLAVSSGNGDRINIYSLRTYKAKKYLWRGYSKVKIINIVFDPDDRFVCLLSDKLTFHIYPLLRKYLNVKAKPENENEQLNEDDDDNDYYNYGKRKPNKVKTLLKNVRKEMGKKYKDSFAKFKDEKVLINDVVFFYLNDKKDLVVYDQKGRVLIIKFNKKKGGICWLHQTKYLEVTEF